MSAMHKAGSVDGKHYTEWTDAVRKLKRDGDYADAIALLLRLIDAVEAEAAVASEKWGIAPWHYEQLAIIYRKEKRLPDEIEVLERYCRQEEPSDGSPSKLAERLTKARARTKK